MSGRDQKAAADAATFPSIRIASLVAQLRAEEMQRQASGSPDPLASFAPIEGQLSEAAERGEGLVHAEVLKLRADLRGHRQTCEARLKRSNRVDGLWCELLELLRKWER